MTADPKEQDTEDSQWRFSLSDLDGESADGADDADESGNSGNIAGSFRVDEELEAEDISVENALFVVVGVVLAVAFVLGFVTLFP
jgi:hypothetical protein